MEKKSFIERGKNLVWHMRGEECEMEAFDERVKALVRQAEPAESLEREVIRKMRRIKTEESERVNSMERKWNAKRAENVDEGYEDQIYINGASSRPKWMKAATALIMLVILAGITGTVVNGGTKEGYLKHIYSMGMDQHTYSDKVSDYTCEILEYEVADWIGDSTYRTTDDLEIIPVQICSDGLRSFATVKVVGKNGTKITKNMHFDEAGMALIQKDENEIEQFGTVGEHLVRYDKDEHAIYYTLEEFGENLSAGQVVTFQLSGEDWWDKDKKTGKEVLHEGRYITYVKAKIGRTEHLTLHDDALFGKGGFVKVSPMGMLVQTYFGEEGNLAFFDKLQGKSIAYGTGQANTYVNRKDGSRVDVLIHGGSGLGDSIMSFSEIVPLSEIESVEVAGKTLKIR